jgi:hypothetical protein
MRNLVNLANFGHCLVSVCRVQLMTSQLGSKVISWTFQIGLKVVQEMVIYRIVMGPPWTIQCNYKVLVKCKESIKHMCPQKQLSISN